MDELKACPFCGGTNINVWSWLSPYAIRYPKENSKIYHPTDQLKIFADVKCECGFGTSNGGFFEFATPKSMSKEDLDDAYKIASEKAEKKAISEWNHRTQPENKPLTLEQLKSMDGEPVWCAISNRNGVVEIKESHGRKMVVIGFNYGWEWAEDVLACSKGGVYRYKPEQEEKDNAK